MNNNWQLKGWTVSLIFIQIADPFCVKKKLSFNFIDVLCLVRVVI